MIKILTALASALLFHTKVWSFSIPNHHVPRYNGVALYSSSISKTSPQVIPTAPFKSPNAFNSSKFSVVEGPSLDTKPDYENVHGPLGKAMDTVFMKMFRSRMAEKVGVDSKLPHEDYQGLMELTAAMNARYSDRLVVQRLSQTILVSLFPSWMPGSYAVLFSKPFPAFSSRMNAWATMVAGTWLMGECEINDVELEHVDSNGKTQIQIGKDQGLLVKRCRFLEESGCASVCVNSCKIPTQNFFIEEMGLPLTMTPDYETYECQFSFGVTPSEAGEIDARNTPCLSRCPSSGGMRQWHSGKGKGAGSITEEQAVVAPQCSLMEDHGDVQ